MFFGVTVHALLSGCFLEVCSAQVWKGSGSPSVPVASYGGMWLHRWCFTDYTRSCFYKHLEYYCAVNLSFTSLSSSLLTTYQYLVCLPYAPHLPPLFPPALRVPLSLLVKLSPALSCVSSPSPVFDPFASFWLSHAAPHPVNPLHIYTEIAGKGYRQHMCAERKTHTHTFTLCDQGLCWHWDRSKKNYAALVFCTIKKSKLAHPQRNWKLQIPLFSAYKMEKEQKWGDTDFWCVWDGRVRLVL